MSDNEREIEIEGIWIFDDSDAAARRLDLLRDLYEIVKDGVQLPPELRRRLEEELAVEE